jgi:long-chain acyl-CoA synthetase
LSSSCYQALAEEVSEIIHAAADIRFSIPLDESRLTNVVGTANVLAFARHCRGLVKFAHLSTLFVAGRTPGPILEERLSEPIRFANAYQQSKFEAEHLVFKAAESLPVAVYRLSTIIGDSRSGEVRQFNYVHHLLKLLRHNVLPVAPTWPGAPIDLIPEDWAIATLAALYEARFAPGRVFHVCAGPAASLTLPELIDRTVQAFEEHSEGRRWLPLQIPRLVPLSEYEAYVKERRQKGDRLLMGLLRALDLVLPHLGIYQAFAPPAGVPAPEIRETYARVVRWCLDTDWGLRSAGC